MVSDISNTSIHHSHRKDKQEFSRWRRNTVSFLRRETIGLAEKFVWVFPQHFFGKKQMKCLVNPIESYKAQKSLLHLLKKNVSMTRD